MKRLFIIFLLLSLSSCSLFKLSIKTAERPLSSQQLLSRVMVRGFYGDFCYHIIECADSIISSTDDVVLELNAIRFKKGATSACAVAVYNAVPDVAMVNTWALVMRMKDMLDCDKGKEYFGCYSSYVSSVCSKLSACFDTVAISILDPTNFMQTRSFVCQYSTDNPMCDLMFTNNDLAVEYASFVPESDYTSVGLLTEVLSDMNDRMGGYSRQVLNDFSWSKDAFMLQLKSDSVGGDVKLYADSLRKMFTQTISVFDSVPVYLYYGSEEFNKRIIQIDEGMQRNVFNLFSNITARQQAFECFVEQQRVSMASDIDYIVAMAITRIERAVPEIVRSLVIWVVILFVALSFIPFLAGFMIGRGKSKKKTPKFNL